MTGGMRAETHLKFPRMHAVVALNEWVAQVVDAELLQALEGPIVKIKVVGVPARAAASALPTPEQAMKAWMTLGTASMRTSTTSHADTSMLSHATMQRTPYVVGYAW